MRFIMDEYKNKVKFNQQKETMKLVITNNFETPEKIFEFLISFSQEVINLFGVEIKEAESVIKE